MIAEWFFDRFEDPSTAASNHGFQGGDLYIHGGPYDAREAIEAEFSAVVRPDVIDKAIGFVESDGTFEWAPSPNHPDYIAYNRGPERSPDEGNHFFDSDGRLERGPVGLSNLGEGEFYNAPWDSKLKISPSEVRSLSLQQQRELIEHWFYYLFEALPDERVNWPDMQRHSFDQRRDYKARDVILNEFIEIADQNVILDVISKIQGSGGAVWGPGPYHPDRIRQDGGVNTITGRLDVSYFLRPDGDFVDPPPRDTVADHDQIDARLEHGARTSFGTSYDRAVRRTVQAHAEALRALLAKAEPKSLKHGGIGHNQPPSDIELEEEHKEELVAAVDTISEELAHEQPNVRKVSRAARVIQSIGQWVAKKLDMTLDAFLKTFAGGLAGLALLKLDVIIQETLKFYQFVIDWLNAVVLPF